MSSNRTLYNVVKRGYTILSSGRNSVKRSYKIGSKSFSRPFSALAEKAGEKSSVVTQCVLIGTGVFAGIGLGQKAYALGQDGETRRFRELGKQEQNEAVLQNRIRGDVCRLSPNLSDLVVDITELLKEKHSLYIAELTIHKATLEECLASRNGTDHMLPMDAERVRRARQDYKSALNNLENVINSVQMVSAAAKTLGADACVGNSERAVREAMFVRDGIVKIVQQSEEHLLMAEKLFRSRHRRQEGRDSKIRLS